MAKRGPKKRLTSTSSLGVEPLKSQNIMVGGHRTSMRLEPSMWDALEDIARREGMTINKLCTEIKERIDRQAELRGIPPEKADVTLTSAVRVFIAAYYRRACTEDGHQRAGHGGNDPFVGTPFELGPNPEDVEPTGGEGETQSATSGFPAPGKPTGLSSMPFARWEA